MPSLEDVHVQRGGCHALRGIRATVSTGEIVGLIGADVAGKTTKLATISGLLRPAPGLLSFTPKPGAAPLDLGRMRAEAIVRHGIPHCPEGRQVFANLTVAENLTERAFLRQDKTAVAADFGQIQDQFVILRTRAAFPRDRLSGGEQMMLVIGRALMSRHKLLLLDEPSPGLAPQLVEQIFDTLERLRREGMTILRVEQNAAMALKIADRADVLEAGKIVLTGTGRALVGNAAVQRAYLGAAL